MQTSFSRSSLPTESGSVRNSEALSDTALREAVLSSLKRADNFGDDTARSLRYKWSRKGNSPLSASEREELLKLGKEYNCPELYCFPDVEEIVKDLHRCTRAKLVSDLSRVVNSGASYENIRDDYCAANLALNRRESRGPAPLFRPSIIIPVKPKWKPEHILLLRDQQVIGLHWYWERRRDVLPNPSNFELTGLFEDEKFNFVKASSIAVLDWKAEKKAEQLGLNNDFQLEVPVFHGRKNRERWQRIRNDEQRIRTDLLNQARQPTSRLNIEDINERVLEYRCLALAKGSPIRAVFWWVMITDRDRDPASRERRRKVFTKRKKELFSRKCW